MSEIYEGFAAAVASLPAESLEVKGVDAPKKDYKFGAEPDEPAPRRGSAFEPTPPPAPITFDGDSGNTSAQRLRSLVERIERLDEEKKALTSDIKDVYNEAGSAGFDKKVLRRLVAQRRREPAEVEEEEQLLDVYRRAIERLAAL